MKRLLSPQILRYRQHARVLSIALLVLLLGLWYVLTLRPAFDASNYSQQEIMLMEFNGDIITEPDGSVIWNPRKVRGFPGPGRVLHKALGELRHAFDVNGPNDHGIGWLAMYTTLRFLIGFLAALLVGVVCGISIGMHPVLFRALNPYIQILKPISPLAWMPLLLATVEGANSVTVLVVFLAALWPTIASTSYGVSSMPKEYLQVARLLEMGRYERFGKVILPASAPAIIAGMRISFGSALVAVVPAEMLTSELGVGNYTWVVWNNGDLAGVLFGIFVIGFLGVVLDGCVSLLARAFNYHE